MRWAVRLDTEKRSITSSMVTPAWRAAASVASAQQRSAFQNDTGLRPLASSISGQLSATQRVPSAIRPQPFRPHRSPRARQRTGPAEIGGTFPVAARRGNTCF